MEKNNDISQKSIDICTLPVIAVGPKNSVVLQPDGTLKTIDNREAAKRVFQTPHVLVNAPMLMRRLNIPSIEGFDVLELYAFSRPAKHCLPTVSGILNALNLQLPSKTLEDQVIALRAAAEHLMQEMARDSYAYRAGAKDVLAFMHKGGWLWANVIRTPLETYTDHSRENGLMVWSALDEWEEKPPRGAPKDDPVASDEAIERLKHLLGSFAEERPEQERYTRAATHAFSPCEMEDGPNTQLLEAGTGTGKTLGYIAPAVVWAEKNDHPVWLSTYTKNLQRQIDQELEKVWPDPKKRMAKAVIRKGRENYVCLLNIEETLRAVMGRVGGPNHILMGLVLRWIRYSRDGDMVGGDFPSWLGAYFGAGRIAGLTDRRGECLYSACTHYRKCFIEKVSRKAKSADIVVANHALILSQSVANPDGLDLPSRVVFDEGHHIFDAADSSFSAHLTGTEGADLRRWLRGKEQGGTTRARGLKTRVEELIIDDKNATQILDQIIHAAGFLPTHTWLTRVIDNTPQGDFEHFLYEIKQHVGARAKATKDHTLEASTDLPSEALMNAAKKMEPLLSCIHSPMVKLSRILMQKLNDESDSLDIGTRGRLESAARSLKLRAETIKGWTDMTHVIGGNSNPLFKDWFAIERINGHPRDIGHHRHYIDPSKPFAELVLTPLKGVAITSATLRDKSGIEEDWASADIRTGVQHLITPPKRLSVESPFDYVKNTRIIVVTDVNKFDSAQVAAAYRALIMASNGSALGLFTAISRLRRTYDAIISSLEDANLPLYAQHVDPIDTATLVDIFREDITASLLGTDAVRDGVDVPGKSLRMIIFDRTPWPRPTLLHKARRDAFGGKLYDEMLTRLKLSQAFGRLVRKADDKGVFVMLDAQTPTRLLSALPAGVDIQRVGLAEAITITKKFLEA